MTSLSKVLVVSRRFQGGEGTPLGFSSNAGGGGCSAAENPNNIDLGLQCGLQAGPHFAPELTPPPSPATPPARAGP